MLNKKMHFYIRKIKIGTTKTVKILLFLFNWIFTVPVEENKVIPSSKNKIVINKQTFKHVSFYFSLAFFIVVTLSFLIIPKETLAGGEITHYNGGEARTITKVWESLKNTFTSGISGYINNAFSEGFAQIAVIVLQLASLILGIAGMLLDYVIDFTITDLGANIQSMKDGGINTAWTMLRDLANMLFIFVLLYVSIATIIQLSSVDTKRMLKNVVVVALLINFSMFFTEVVIDITNTFAAAFHGALVREVVLESGDNPEDVSISEAFMNSTKLVPSFFDGENNSAAISKAANGDFFTTIALSSVLLAFILVLSFVFLAGAFFLIVRFIMFILLIILSPLAFVSVIIPQTSGSFQRWFKSLANNALFAPIFMALLWVSIVLLKTTEAPPEGMTVASAATGKLGGNADVVVVDSSAAVFTAILAIGFVFAALLIAKTLSIHGASKVTEIGKKWGRTALRGGARGAVGGVAIATNRTAGRYAAKRADSKELKEKAAKGDNWAKMQLMAYDKISRTGKKGGFRGAEERRKEKAKKRADLYKTSDREKDRVRNLQEQAKASKDPQEMKSAQQERDRVLGVDSKDLKKRKDLVEKAVNRKILALQKRIQNNSALRPLSDQEIALEKEKHRNRITKNMEKKGFTMKEELSQEQKLQSEYVKSIKDNILFNNANIREALRNLKKEEK
jgi:hypothetical protein